MERKVPARYAWLTWHTQCCKQKAWPLEELALETVIISRKVPSAFNTEQAILRIKSSLKNVPELFYQMSSGLILISLMLPLNVKPSVCSMVWARFVCWHWPVEKYLAFAAITLYRAMAWHGPARAQRHEHFFWKINTALWTFYTHSWKSCFKEISETTSIQRNLFIKVQKCSSGLLQRYGFPEKR